MKKQDAVHICDACGKETSTFYYARFSIYENLTSISEKHGSWFDVCRECAKECQREKIASGLRGTLPMVWFRKWFKK